MRNRERERRAQRKRCEQEIRLQMFVLAVGAALLLFLVIVGIGRWREAVAERKRLEAERALLEREEELLSDSVLEYEDLVKYYAEEEGIYEYVPVLLAIMEVETKGERDDVMQSSESAGLEPNSLGPEASIAQACDYSIKQWILSYIKQTSRKRSNCYRYVFVLTIYFVHENIKEKLLLF